LDGEALSAMCTVRNGLHLLWVSVNLAAAFWASTVMSYMVLQAVLSPS